MKFYAAAEGWTRAKVHAEYPQGCRVVAVDGGFMAFESDFEYATWRNQK